MNPQLFLRDSKEQLCQIINQQQTTIQSLLSERQWLIDDYHIQELDIQKFKQKSIQWETYANALTEELNHARQDLAKLTESHEILKDKYEAVKGMYWEVKEENDAHKPRTSRGAYSKMVCFTNSLITNYLSSTEEHGHQLQARHKQSVRVTILKPMISQLSQIQCLPLICFMQPAPLPTFSSLKERTSHSSHQAP